LDFEDYTVETKARWAGRSCGSLCRVSISGQDSVRWSAAADGLYNDYEFFDNGSRFRYPSYIPQLNSWHVLKMVKTGSSFFFYDNGVLIYTHFSSSTYEGIATIGIQSEWLAGDEIDWIRISDCAPDSGPVSIGMSTEKDSYLPGQEIDIVAHINGIGTDSYHYDWHKILPEAPSSYKPGRIVSDGECLYIIGTRNLPNSDRFALLLRMDENGTEMWNRTWGVTKDNVPINLIFQNEIIYVVGSCADGVYPDSLFLLAYNESGDELWNRTWSMSATSALDWVTGLSPVDDAIYVSGWSVGNGPDSIEAFVVKFNLTIMGIEWSRTWGGAGDQFCEDITCLNNALYLAVYDLSAGLAGLVKYDMDGNLLWNRTWGNHSVAYSVTNDGVNILIVGDGRVAGNQSGYLRVYSETGELRMERLNEAPGLESSVFEVRAKNGIAYCAGMTRNPSSASSTDALLMGYDIETGTEVLDFTWGGIDEDTCNGITILDDSSVYFSGGTKSFHPGTLELFVLKYSNRSNLADIPASIRVENPSRRPILDLSAPTNLTGTATVSFILPPDGPEGVYNCTSTATLSGRTYSAYTTFRVAWPWSPVLTVVSSDLVESCSPGDPIGIRAYAGYEYSPAHANRSAPGIKLAMELLAPNGTVLVTFDNSTDAIGWADLCVCIPGSCPTGTHTIRIRGFEGLSRELQVDVVRQVGKAPQGTDVPPNIPVGPIAGTATICLIATGIAITATETGKFGFIAPFVPIYTRIRRDKALSQRVRHQIMGYLMDNPGQHFNALRKALKLSNSMMVHHLLVLEREGYIKSQPDGTKKRFYPVTVKVPDVRKRTPRELVSEILVAVEEHPGITHKEMVERLLVGNEAVKYHMRNLVREGKILSSKKGNMRVYYPVKK
jgi:DNA-binding transcriptional ArsR family regulator